MLLYCSGFKELTQSEAESHSDSPKNPLRTENVTNSEAQRTSTRLKKANEKKENMSTSEQYLKQIVKKKRLMKTKNGIWKDEELLRWTPTIILKRLTKREIERASNDWSFLDHVRIISEVILSSEVVAHHNSLDGKSRILLRWTHPRGICRYEWTESKDFPKTNVVDVQKLRWNEKLLLHP